MSVTNSRPPTDILSFVLRQARSFPSCSHMCTAQFNDGEIKTLILNDRDVCAIINSIDRDKVFAPEHFIDQHFYSFPSKHKNARIVLRPDHPLLQLDPS